MAGMLYMLPVPLIEDGISRSLPSEAISLAQRLDTFIVENEKTARRFLSQIKTLKPVRELTLLTLNEHTADKELPGLLTSLLAGKDVGLMSEAGCPGIADPGARLVALAHQKGIPVSPLAGPSSILLGLMASGFNGQRFRFLGYLPSGKNERIQQIKTLEKESQKSNETQIFIETPYRNQHLLEDILASCLPQTRLCVACDLTSDRQLIISKPISEWRTAPLPDLHKRPTIFLILA